jgi:glutathione S-transferase
MRLYYRPRSGRPMRVAWALEELALDYEVVALSSEQCVEDAHLARHPLGRVPALEFDDGQTMFESTAIVLALADMFPDAGLAGPLGSSLRRQVYEWSIFAMTELERTVLNARPAIEHVEEEFRATNREAAARVVAAIGQQLGQSELLLGNALTAADIVAGGVLAVVDFVGLDIMVEPVARYVQRLRDRPAFARAVERTESPIR